MRRREFIALMGASATWPFAAMAQQPGRTYRLGVLLPLTRDAPVNMAFLEEFRRLGFIEGQNLTVEWRAYGIIAPQGREGVKELLAIVANDARASLLVLAAQLQALQTTIGAIEKRIVVQHRADKQSKRLQTIPGIGPIGASAIAATVTNPKIFRSGRDFAAWIGLVPRQMSTGGKLKLGPISKQGDRYLRRLLVVGAVSTLRRAKQNPQKFPWITRLLARRPFKVVAVALANKMARIAWALLISDKTCRSAWFAAA